MKPILCPALLAAALLVPAGGAAAHPALLGGFRPVASEQSARALWVNPAAVGVTGQGAAVAELLVNGDEAAQALDSASQEKWSLPKDVYGFSAAASTDRLAYGYQDETKDLPGVPDWTFAVGNAVKLGQGVRIGATAEWRGGNDSGLDATAGLLMPFGQRMMLAAVARDLLARDVDGTDGHRSWQVGAAVPLRPALGTFTWDAMLQSSESPIHWFAFSIDRAARAHASVARSSDGEWSVTLALVAPNRLLGVGATERKGGARPDRGFVAAEWRGTPFPGTATQQH